MIAHSEHDLFTFSTLTMQTIRAVQTSERFAINENKSGLVVFRRFGTGSATVTQNDSVVWQKPMIYPFATVDNTYTLAHRIKVQRSRVRIPSVSLRQSEWRFECDARPGERRRRLDRIRAIPPNSGGHSGVERPGYHQ